MLKKNIIFDFDGVIINSHKIKTKAFFEIFKSYGKKVANNSKKFHEKNIGKSRYYKFDFVFKNFLNKKIKKSEIRKLDQNFENFVQNKIERLKPSKNLLSFFERKKNTYNFYILTGTPQNKIKKILHKKKLIKYFKKIYGGPKSKVNHIRNIKKTKLKTLFIGDSYEDYLASKKTNIIFILKLNSENLIFRNRLKVKKINSFKYIEKIVDNLFV